MSISTIKSYQELKEGAEQPTILSNIATVAEIYADGITLIFDGSSSPTTKRYKCNDSISFKVGDRVHIARENGTCIVEYRIGNPK